MNTRLLGFRLKPFLGSILHLVSITRHFFLVLNNQRGPRLEGRTIIYWHCRLEETYSSLSNHTTVVYVTRSRRSETPVPEALQPTSLSAATRLYEASKPARLEDLLLPIRHTRETADCEGSTCFISSHVDSGVPRSGYWASKQQSGVVVINLYK